MSTKYNLFDKDRKGIKACSHFSGFDEKILLKNLRLIVKYALAFSLPLPSAPAAKSILESRKKIPTPKCVLCGDALQALHACLHCLHLACFTDRHIHTHLNNTLHKFAVDFNLFNVYCSDCGDYVYDMEFDAIVNTEKYKSAEKYWCLYDTGFIGFQYNGWTPGEKELELLKNRSTIPSCSGIRGLTNLGNTCFMSVILQAFLHNPLLKSHFLSEGHNNKLCTTPLCLGCQLDNLFQEMYSGKKSPYGPTLFLHHMWLSSTEMAGYAQQDAHEFFISVINQLHSNLTQGNEQSTHNHNCRCIIHRTFAGLLQSDVTCHTCSTITTAFDPVVDFSLDVSVTMQKGDKTETLLTCLERYTKPERLGPGQYICSKCGNTAQEASKELSIKKLPPVLCFQLKRFEHKQNASKLVIKIRCPFEINMAPFTTMYKENHRKKDKLKPLFPTYAYKLFAVINHEGSLETGHYTMFAKERDQWFRFGDHKVTLAPESEVLESEAYMCFYIKTHLEYSDYKK